LYGGSEENHAKLPVRIAGISAEIQTNYFPNTKIKSYYFTDLFVNMLSGSQSTGNSFIMKIMHSQ
jgi:hypothetical protein